jgi:acyl dehydratase
MTISWECPFVVGEFVETTMAFTNQDILEGARFMNDRNPLHNDVGFAASTRFGALIACGPHISGLHSCMLPTWFSQQCAVLGVEFTTRYLAPVFADREYTMRWEIVAITPGGSGYSLNATGVVTNDRAVAISSEATLLLKESL